MSDPTEYFADGKETPTEEDAAAIFRDCIGQTPSRIRRFPTGLAHHVFDIGSETGSRVVRIGSRRGCGTFDGAIYWSNRLRSIGVPLAAILHAGSHDGFEYLVLERLAGTDLCHVYGGLSAKEKREIAAGVVAAQECVHRLPEGSGYGYVGSYEGLFPHSTWRGVVEANLARSRERIEATKVVDPAITDRIEWRLDGLDDYFRAVPPRAFLDDTTTKNVICDGGRLSGIVDVDEICFGDPLFTPALTLAALLADGLEQDYVEYWLERLALCEEQLAAFHLYTAVFCLDLIGEAGQRFNRAAAVAVDGVRIQRLSAAIGDYLDERLTDKQT